MTPPIPQAPTPFVPFEVYASDLIHTLSTTSIEVLPIGIGNVVLGDSREVLLPSLEVFRR